MPEAKKLFTDSFAKKVRKAIELNKVESGEVYHHPKEQRIVKKCIDLSCQKPLRDANNEHPKPSCSAERWLEAYLIRKAMRNNRQLELAGKNYYFLYSQLNFRGKPPRPLDLLLYEPKARNMVIMELKARRELGRAKEQLDYYSKKVSGLKEEFAKVFRLGEISGVQGHIVWPRNERADNNKHDFGPFGVIEYKKIAEPWMRYRVGEDLIVDFVCVRESQVK